MDTIKTIEYKGYSIELQYSGYYSCYTYEYGVIKSDTLKGMKRMLNELK